MNRNLSAPHALLYLAQQPSRQPLLKISRLFSRSVSINVSLCQLCITFKKKVLTSFENYFLIAIFSSKDKIHNNASNALKPFNISNPQESAMTDCILSCGSVGFSAHRFLLVSGADHFNSLGFRWPLMCHKGGYPYIKVPKKQSTW